MKVMMKNFLSIVLSMSALLTINTFAAQTTRSSIAPGGVNGNSSSFLPDFSADGRYVAFVSGANNLVAGDTNLNQDIFVYDRQLNTTERVSVGNGGVQANAGSMASQNFPVSMSADGRFVVFESFATNLVTGDTNGFRDIFVHDRQTHQTTRISLAANGTQSNGDSQTAQISADGRFVVFQSSASNLVANDTNLRDDIFVHDRVTRQTTRVSVNSLGAQTCNQSAYPSISANGRFVAFQSACMPSGLAGPPFLPGSIYVHDRASKQTNYVNVNSTGAVGNGSDFNPVISNDGRFVVFASSSNNLVLNDTNGVSDIFVHDRSNGQTTRVSIDSTGIQGNAESGATFYHHSISANNRYVAFTSLASNLVVGDTNARADVFLHDRVTGQTTRVGVASNGAQANDNVVNPRLSADGRYVSFYSDATNLVAGDTNNFSDVFVRDRLINPSVQANLSISVTQKPASLVRNTNGTFLYTITNSGPNTANGISLSHLVNLGVVISFTPSQGSCTRATLSVCNLGALVSGASLTLQAVVKATGTDPLSQKLSVGAIPLDSVPANNAVTVSTPITP